MKATHWIIAMSTAAVIASAGLGLASAHSGGKGMGYDGSMMDPEARTEQQLNRLSERLDLDDAQRTAIADILAEHHGQMRAMRAAIEAVLTDAQRERMTSMDHGGRGMSERRHGYRSEGGCSHGDARGEGRGMQQRS